MDHLMAIHDIVPFYVDQQKNFYQLDPALLYSNTPSDFDFKLSCSSEGNVILDKGDEGALDRGSISSNDTGSLNLDFKCPNLNIGNGSSVASCALAEDDPRRRKSIKLSEEELIKTLKTFDLVFPAIHGDFGETGELQALLERNQIPFVGCSSEACLNMYYKDRAALVLKQAGHDTLPSITVQPVIPDKPEGRRSGIQEKELDPDFRQDDIKKFFIQHNITRAVVKPIAGGSSIGVHSVTSADQVIAIASEATVPMLIEPFCEGREFTVIVLQNPAKEPVALVPTEIQISYEGGAIFDYRRKYLPTSNTTWACPPNFPEDVIQKIRTDAEAIFRLFKMRDFARLDGWVMNDGRILFTDMNPISGMEQNSFIFQQTSRMGMTHQEALGYVIAQH